MRKIYCLVLCCSLLFISGCWDQQEIQDLSVIKVLTVDKVADEAEPWLVSVLVINPSAGGAKGDSTEKKIPPETPWMGSGATIQEAVGNFIKRSPRFAFYGYTNVLIIGENAAKEGVNDLIEAAERYSQTRPRLRVMVTQGLAKDITETEPEASRTISEELKATSEHAVQRMGLSLDVNLTDFHLWLLCHYRDPVAGKVMIIYPQEKRGETRAGPFSSILIEGLAVFREDKLVGWLNKEETLGYLLMTNSLGGAEIPIKIDYEGKVLSYYLERTKPTLTTRLVDGKLEADIHIKTVGTMTENKGVVLSRENLEALEQRIDERLLQIAETTVQKVQGYQSDCLGLTENLYHFHQAQFKTIESDWRNAFTGATINITVESQIQNTGGLSESFQ